MLDALDKQIRLIDATGDARLNARRAALILKAQDALDPAKPELGVRANPRKTWAGLKALRGATIKQ